MRFGSFASVRSTVIVATLSFALSACLDGGGTSLEGVQERLQEGSQGGSTGGAQGGSQGGSQQGAEVNQPGAEANPAAVERAVRRIALFDDRRGGRRPGEIKVTRHHYSRVDPKSGSSYRAWSQSSNEAERPGLSVVHAAPWRDEDGEVHFNIVMEEHASRANQRDPSFYTGRYVATHRDVAGTTVTKELLGAGSTKPGWLGFEAASTQTDGGTLNVRYFTDATDDDFALLRETYDFKEGSTRVIALDDPSVPARPVDRAYLHVVVPDAGLSGTLDGAAGRFTCAGGAGASCALSSDIGDRGYFPRLRAVVFTPDDGSGAVTLPAGASVSVPKVDYISFGYWLYAPETLEDGDAWDFGVFAGGDDPFDVANLRPFTGSADYAGAAAGVWASGKETVPFTADVALTARFGAPSNLGRVEGNVSGFALENGAAAPLSNLHLRSVSYSYILDVGHRIRNHVTVSADNIFPDYTGVTIPGSWVEGWAHDGEGMSEEERGEWSGVWGGQFFGNGESATDHPSAFAGTFGAVHPSQGSIAGAFGAHKQ